MSKTLYVIDGHAQIFRAYHAIRTELTSPVTGETTQAVYGFAVMMLKLLSKYNPDYLAVAIDMPGKTFRDELYDQYKATRTPAPEDLHTQAQRIFEMIRLFGVPLIGVEGAEADDVIATIVRQVHEDDAWQGVDVRIVSRDKDLEQLLDDRVTMFDIHKDETIDAAALLETRGVRPGQVIDLLTLTGDSVDNIPGVVGIGPKTAAMLIGEFGSIDGIYQNLDKIKGKRRENLEAARDHLPLSRRLVTLKNDVDLDLTADQARIGPVDIEGLRRLFQQMGFRRLEADLDRLAARWSSPRAADPVQPHADDAPQAASVSHDDAPTTGLFALMSDEDDGSPVTTEPAAGEYSAITTKQQLDQLAATLRSQSIISVDTETIGLAHDAPICGLSFAWETGRAVYVPVQSPEPSRHLDSQTVFDALRGVLEDPRIGKCGHNLKYDALVLQHGGVRLGGIVFDSMIAAHLIGLPARSLDDVALSQLNRQTIPIRLLIGSRVSAQGRRQTQKTMDQVPLEHITPYAAEDADVALQLYEKLSPQLKAMGLNELAQRVEMPLVGVLVDMQAAGIRVDPDELERQKEALGARIDELRDAIHEAAGEPFNLDSPKQLSEVLFKKLKLPAGKRTKTGASTDIEVLEKLADSNDLTEEQKRVPRLMVEYRQLTKLVGTYLEALRDAINPRTGRIHANFHQTGTATGRLSSSGPNLQNIPIRTDIGRQIRKAFVAEPGYRLVSADYSQIELRVLAHLSEDPALVAAFKADQDIHAAVAAQVFGVELNAVTPEQRDHAKTINFGIVYGITPYGLARRIADMDVDAAGQLIADYRKRFAGIDAFLQRCIDQATRLGHVTTIMGRRRDIPQITSRNGNTRALGERLAINSVVQGSAADLIKLAMVNLHRQIHDESLPIKILLQIHDELVIETPERHADDAAAALQHQMEHAMALRVPLKVDLGRGVNWFDAK